MSGRSIVRDAEKEYHYEGFLDPNDVTECECGCEFTTMYLEDEDGNRFE